MKHLQGKRKMRGAALLLSGVLCFSGGVLPSKAAPKGPDADVYMNVLKRDTHALLSVTLPTTYAFAVNGTTKLDSQVEISVAADTLLLPNVTIKLKNETDPSKGYEVELTGPPSLPFRNYSTVTAEQDADGNVNFDNGLRTGAAVFVNGYLEEEGTGRETRGGWDAVTEDTDVTTAEANFKNYKITLGEGAEKCAFSKPDQEAGADKIWLDKKINLAAPSGELGYDSAGLAKVPFEAALPLDVKVGGRRGQYHVAESSVKAGTIRWSVEIQ